MNLRGEDPYDSIGYAIDIGQVDGQPVLVIGEPSAGGGLAAVHLLSEPPVTSSTLRDRSQLRIDVESIGHTVGMAVALLPSTEEIYYSAVLPDLAAQTFPASRRGVYMESDATGWIPEDVFGVRGSGDLSACVGSNGEEYACVPTFHVDDDLLDYSGTLALLEIPLVGEHTLDEARTQLRGDPSATDGGSPRSAG